AQAVGALAGRPLQYRVSHLVARLFFRGIYFPQMTRAAWLRLLFENRATISRLAREGAATWRAARKKQKAGVLAAPPA
nr:hypothetical protein [Acidobacteriota bacterium]